MLEKVKKVAPKIFEKAGAACVVLGYCPETESCGRAPPLKEIIGTHRKGKAKRED